MRTVPTKDLRGPDRPLILLDPPSEHYYADRLFDIDNNELNRDSNLLPAHRLRERALAMGREIHTADWIRSSCSREVEYYSLGLLYDDTSIKKESSIRFAAALIMEPPVVAPSLYAQLPQFAAKFERVYVHNVYGMGYSLKGVDVRKLRKLYWPIPYRDALEPYWSSEGRANRIVAISGNHNPRFRAMEQYSKRIQAMSELARFGAVDLYGFNWDKWFSREAMFWTYWRHRSMLLSIYKGRCSSKFEVLSRYNFSLCFENMAMDGYITEKLFDCLYAGTIPLYLGAPDIETYVPTDVFIDCRQFSTWTEMWERVRSFSREEVQRFREAGRDFLRGPAVAKFYHSIEDIVFRAT